MTRLTDEFDFDAWVTRQIRDCEQAMDSEPGRVWVDAVLLWNVLKGMQHWQARAEELEAENARFRAMRADREDVVMPQTPNVWFEKEDD